MGKVARGIPVLLRLGYAIRCLVFLGSVAPLPRTVGRLGRLVPDVSVARSSAQLSGLLLLSLEPLRSLYSYITRQLAKQLHSTASCQLPLAFPKPATSFRVLFFFSLVTSVHFLVRHARFSASILVLQQHPSTFKPSLIIPFTNVVRFYRLHVQPLLPESLDAQTTPVTFPSTMC